jgi:hypothetical protein
MCHTVAPRGSSSVSAVEPRRPRIGILVTIAVVTAGFVTGSIAVLNAPDATDRAREGAAAGDDAPESDIGPAASLRGTSMDGAPYTVWSLDHRGAPLRWDACAPVNFVANLLGATDDAEHDIRRALDILSDATGIPLILEGLTDEAPDVQRPLVEPDGLAWRWRPVLIAWARPGAGATHGLDLSTADRGLALPVAVRDGDLESYVTGQVVLNADRTDLVAGFEDRSTSIGATLLHEIAHVLGLDHVDDPGQLLSVDPGSGPVTLGSGDLAGLERIGSAAGCNPAPPPSAGRGLAVAR